MIGLEEVIVTVYLIGAGTATGLWLGGEVYDPIPQPSRARMAFETLVVALAWPLIIVGLVFHHV